MGDVGARHHHTRITQPGRDELSVDGLARRVRNVEAELDELMDDRMEANRARARVFRAGRLLLRAAAVLFALVFLALMLLTMWRAFDVVSALASSLSQPASWRDEAFTL